MRLFVGNLSWDADEEGLKALFETQGTVVSARVITDQFTGRSKGFGFVEMSNDEEGKAAVAELDGADLHGRPIRVSEARSKQGGDRPRRSYAQEGFRDRT